MPIETSLAIVTCTFSQTTRLFYAIPIPRAGGPGSCRRHLSWPKQSQAPLGKKVENFTLNDYHGQPHSLDQVGKDKIVVLAFLGTECPLAKLYAPRLAELAKEYEPKGVVFLGIDSNRQDAVDRNRGLRPSRTKSSFRSSRI